MRLYLFQSIFDVRSRSRESLLIFRARDLEEFTGPPLAVVGNRLREHRLLLRSEREGWPQRRIRATYLDGSGRRDPRVSPRHPKSVWNKVLSDHVRRPSELV